LFDLEEWLLGLLAVAVVLGAWGVWCGRGTRDQAHARWGRCAFLVSLLGLGAGNLVALTCAARCLMPFGLAAGWLVIAMLWENPFRVWQEG
jgi:hypothetical protein